MNHEFMEALDELEKDRGIDKEIIIDTIEQALLTAYKKNFGSAQNVRVSVDREGGEVRVYSQRRVVDESDLYDTFLEIELGKVFKIVDREYPEAKKEVLLVVDATTGQNAVSQAKSFKEVCDITGLALTKLDGTAKGGVIFPKASNYYFPIYFSVSFFTSSKVIDASSLSIASCTFFNLSSNIK